MGEGRALVLLTTNKSGRPLLLLGPLVCYWVGTREDRLVGVNSWALKCHLGTLENEGPFYLKGLTGKH